MTTSAATVLARLRHNALVRTSAPYLVAALGALACAFYLLELWRISWDIPMYYWRGGDALQLYSWIKTFADSPPFLTAPELGAPFGAHILDYPTPYLLHFALMRLLTAITTNWAAAVNLYYILFFPLTAVTALYAMRRLGVPLAAAIALAVVYSFLPIRLLRNQSHMFYSSYYLLPLIALIAVWISRGVPLFDSLRRRPLREGAIALVAVLAVSLDTPYHVLFASVLFVAGAAVAVVRTRNWRPAVSTLALLVVMAVGLAIAFSPTLVYHAQHGPNAAALKRRPEEGELLGLQLIQLVLPIRAHRIQSFANARLYYDDRMSATMLDNENATATLGVLGSLGFVGLLVALFVVRRTRDREVWPDVSRLTLIAFILATVGGLGTIFTFYVVKEFRAYNRISSIIAFYSLVGVGFALRSLAARYPRVSAGWRVAAVIVLALIALADETSPAMVPRYRASAERFAADEELAGRVQRSLGPGASVLELPAIRFPEADPVNGLEPYDELFLYLHTHGIRWSFGGMTGRPEGDWAPAMIASKPPREMLEAALIAGFSGIVVFRRGYPDSGAQIERDISVLTGVAPVAGPDGTKSFFAFAALTGGIDRLLALDASGAHRALTPGLTLAYGAAFSPDEGDARHTRWAREAASLVVRNVTNDPIKGSLSFTAASAERADTVTIAAGEDSPRSAALSADGTPLRVDRVFLPGETVVRITPGAPRGHVGADRRAVAFRLSNVVLIGVDVALLRRVSPSL